MSAVDLSNHALDRLYWVLNREHFEGTLRRVAVRAVSHDLLVKLGAGDANAMLWGQAVLFVDRDHAWSEPELREAVLVQMCSVLSAGEKETLAFQREAVYAPLVRGRLRVLRQRGFIK